MATHSFNFPVLFVIYKIVLALIPNQDIGDYEADAKSRKNIYD